MDDQQVLDQVLDELESMLDNHASRRVFFGLVEEAVSRRRGWIWEQCIPASDAVREALRQMPSLPPAEEVYPSSELESFVQDVRCEQGLSHGGWTGPPLLGAGPIYEPGSLLRSIVAAKQRSPVQAPEEEGFGRAIDEFHRIEYESGVVFDTWAREHAERPPHCCAFLWRWHQLKRPVPSLLPGADPKLAAAFDPSAIPAGRAAALLKAVRRELRDVGPSAAEKPGGWTKQELCNQASISPATFERIRERTDVAVPPRGKHGHRYRRQELEQLIAAAAASPDGKRNWLDAAAGWRELLPSDVKA